MKKKKNFKNVHHILMIINPIFNQKLIKIIEHDIKIDVNIFIIELKSMFMFFYIYNKENKIFLRLSFCSVWCQNDKTNILFKYFHSIFEC